MGQSTPDGKQFYKVFCGSGGNISQAWENTDGVLVMSSGLTLVLGSETHLSQETCCECGGGFKDVGIHRDRRGQYSAALRET